MGLFLENKLYKVANLILLSKDDAYSSSSIFVTCTSFRLTFSMEGNQRPVSMVGDMKVPANKHTHTIVPRNTKLINGS